MNEIDPKLRWYESSRNQFENMLLNSTQKIKENLIAQKLPGKDPSGKTWLEIG